MAIIKWDPFGDFERFFGEDFSPMPMPKIGWDLATDVYEEDNNVVAEMNIPGIDSQKIDISIKDGYLRVSGSREEEKEKKRKDYYSKEIRRGSFERVVKLPAEVDESKTKAEHKDGVLRIVMPKISKEKPSRKIKVETKRA